MDGGFVDKNGRIILLCNQEDAVDALKFDTNPADESSKSTIQSHVKMS